MAAAASSLLPRVAYQYQYQARYRYQTQNQYQYQYYHHHHHPFSFSGSFSCGRKLKLRTPSLLPLCVSAKKKKHSGSKNRTRKDYTNTNTNTNNNTDDAFPQSESLGFFPEAVLLKKKKEGQALPEFADAQEEKVYQALSLQLESSLNLQTMRHYEVVFLIHEQHDDQVDQIVTQVEDFIREKKGRIWRLNDWGLRPLAYEVKKAWEAHYILMNFEIDAKFINDFKTMLDKDERVIRHLVTKQDKAETEYSPPPMDYQTLLAKQGIRDDDGFWDDDDDNDDYTMYDDDEEDDEEDGNVAARGKDEGEVIYVDGDGEEDADPDEIQDVVHKVGDVTR